MNYFEEVLEYVKMSKEDFFKIYNLPAVERAEEEERLYEEEPTKYGDYMHLLIAYHKVLKETEENIKDKWNRIF